MARNLGEPVTSAKTIPYDQATERARQALRGWHSYLISVIRAGIKAREIRPRIDAKKLTTIIIFSLEGIIMLYRLERNEEALRAVQDHLDNRLETKVRVPSK